MSYTDSKAKYMADTIIKENEEVSKTLCSAHGCPMEWTVDTGRRLCSAHAWADPHDWPKITDRLITKQALGTLPTFARAQEKAAKTNPNARVVSNDEKKAIINQLRRITNPDPKDWAKKLKDKELAGEPLSLIQRGYWRVALGERE